MSALIVLALLATLPQAATAAEPQFTPDIAPASTFPDARRATRKEGVFVAPATVRLIAPGMTKRQVYPLLGVPHFHEGLFGERRWDYIVNAYTGAGTAYRVCRLQLHWGRGMRLDGIAWNSEECRAAFHQDSVAREDSSPIVATPVETPAPQPVTIHFAFDSADLSPDAEQILGAFVAAMSASGRTISVVGHTDSAGPDAYNDRLSLARADAVARYLGGAGIATSRLRISGAGEHGQALTTADNVPEAANRRAVVTIVAQ
ncbi:OmpA family protein [Sphingobium aquiterrae]|uniref:OmpA family protein n=1 Tax=Sphingobium aquiterrae TaxID=2038656 RepID=UPI00301AC5B3